MLVVNFSVNDIDSVAKTVLKTLKTKTILFYGDMGVGKTTFISALVNALGGEDKTSSPTFSLVNEYEVRNDMVYHFDFYRIEDEQDLLNIGIEDYFYSGHWNFIEWPDKISNNLPFEADVISLKLKENNLRTLKLTVFNN